MVAHFRGEPEGRVDVTAVKHAARSGKRARRNVGRETAHAADHVDVAAAVKESRGVGRKRVAVGVARAVRDVGVQVRVGEGAAHDPVASHRRVRTDLHRGRLQLHVDAVRDLGFAAVDARPRARLAEVGAKIAETLRKVIVFQTPLREGRGAEFTEGGKTRVFLFYDLPVLADSPGTSNGTGFGAESHHSATAHFNDAV